MRAKCKFETENDSSGPYFNLSTFSGNFRTGRGILILSKTCQRCLSIRTRKLTRIFRFNGEGFLLSASVRLQKEKSLPENYSAFSDKTEKMKNESLVVWNFVLKTISWELLEEDCL